MQHGHIMLSAGDKPNMQEQATLSESFHQTLYMMSCVCWSAAVCHKHKDGLKSKYHTLRTTPSFQPSLRTPSPCLVFLSLRLLSSVDNQRGQ